MAATGQARGKWGCRKQKQRHAAGVSANTGGSYQPDCFSYN